MNKLTLDGKTLIPGKFYLWEVATQANTGVVLNSVFFVTDDNKFYEVVFTKQDANNEAAGWYLVEKKVAQEQPKISEPVEAEIVEETPPNTLEIRVEDEMDVRAIFGQPPEEPNDTENPTS